MFLIGEYLQFFHPIFYWSLFTQLSSAHSFKDLFDIANLTFQHQVVYDPVKKQRLPLNPFDPRTETKARV